MSPFGVDAWDQRRKLLTMCTWRGYFSVLTKWALFGAIITVPHATQIGGRDCGASVIHVMKVASTGRRGQQRRKLLTTYQAKPALMKYVKIVLRISDTQPYICTYSVQVTEAYMLSCSYDVRVHMPLSPEHLWYKFYTTYVVILLHSNRVFCFNVIHWCHHLFQKLTDISINVDTELLSVPILILI